MNGILYLIPAPLGAVPVESVLPANYRDIVRRLEVFIVEQPKTARAYLKQIGTGTPLQQLTLLELNEHTRDTELAALLVPLLAGRDVGLISEAGAPGVADPGADLVRLAHAHAIRVIPLAGPSAILLALMGSGLNGQRFAFHGYLPVEKSARLKKLKELEQTSKQRAETQIFIETPYRNRALYEAILETCGESTLLCLATDLTLSTESIMTRAVSAWKSQSPDLEKRPTVFLLLTLTAR